MMRILLLICLLTFSSKTLLAQRIGINSDGSSPDASAMLDVNSIDKGLLIPRLDINDLTTAAPVTAPATGLMAFNTNITTGIGLYYWDGTAWVRFLSENDDVGDENNWKLEGNEDTDPTVNFLGTIDNVDLVIRTNNTEKARITTDGWLGIGTDAPEAFLDVNDDGAIIALQSNAPFIRFHEKDEAKEWYFGGHMGNMWIRENCTDVAGDPVNCLERFTILPGGNIGIGATDPTQRLDIDGQIRIRGGNPVAGRVLTAIDADGNAEWQDAPAGGGGVGIDWTTTVFVNNSNYTVPANVDIVHFYNLNTNRSLTLGTCNAGTNANRQIIAVNHGGRTSSTSDGPGVFNISLTTGNTARFPGLNSWGASVSGDYNVKTFVCMPVSGTWYWTWR